jgi:hypothetical protein
MPGWFGVGLDGTLAKNEGADLAKTIGEPVPLMVKRVQKWISGGIEVRIFTDRVAETGHEGFYSYHSKLTPQGQRKIIEDWCLDHIGTVLPVTCVKDWGMVVPYDHRAVSVERNTGRLASVHGDSDDVDVDTVEAA